MSINELPLAILQVAYNLGVGLALTYLVFQACVQLVDPIRGFRRKSPSRFLWLLGGSLVIGSILWSIQLLATAGFTIPLTSFMTTVLMVLLAAANVRGRQMSRADERAKQTQRARGLQTQSQAWMDLERSQTYNFGNRNKVTQEIAVPADAVNNLERKPGNYEWVPSALTATKALHPSRAKNSTDIISRHMGKGFYLYPSPACLTLLGYKPHELTIHSVCNRQFFHLQYWTGIGQSDFTQWKQAETDSTSYRLHCQSGDYLCFKTTTTPLHHPDLGEVKEIIPVSREITDHKEGAERSSVKSTSLLLNRQASLLFELVNQIRNSLELDTILETAVESIRNALQIDRCHFIWYRSHGVAPYWEVVSEARNPSLNSDIGKFSTDRVGLFGERLLKQQIVRVDAVETLSDPILGQFLLDMGYSSLLSIPIKTKLGEIGAISCVRCTGARIWDDNEVQFLQAVVAQVAIAIERTELYAQVRQATQRAQALEVALNQLKTTQAQLVHSAKMSSLGQLVAGIAHEINNPINFIHGNLVYASAYIYDLLGFLRLYQEQYPNPTGAILEQAEAIDVKFLADDLPKLLRSMQQGSDRIRSIVLSLRNFSRLDEAEMKEVDLHEGIDSTLLILQHRLKAKGIHRGIQIVKEYGHLPTVKCYPGELNQVFLNILTNAIEALEELGVETQQHSSPRITIRTSLIQNSKFKIQNEASPCSIPQSVAIQIADNGLGMSESVLAKIFDPFFTTKPVGQGTGLGLSICYQIIVEHHQGILTCTSALGQGTEFRIEIPING